MRMNHRQIEAFRAVFQTASMTAAAALMGITQPAVSRLICDLEAETALKLFDRSAGKLIPTPDAVALSREVERSYQGLDRVARAAAELGRRRVGALRIAASVAPSVFMACRPSSPSSTRLGQGSAYRCIQAPRRRFWISWRCGIAIWASPRCRRKDRASPLKPCRYKMLSALPARHPLASRAAVRASDLAGVPMLMISAYSHLRQCIMRNFAAMDVQPDIVFELSFSAPICALVAEGFGVSILDPLTAQAYAGPALALRAFEPAVPYELKLVFPAGHPPSDRGSAFAALLRQHLESIAA